MSKTTYLKIPFLVCVIFLAQFTTFAFESKVKDCSVVLEVEFLKTGKVGKVKLVSSTCEKDSGLENKAISAARKIKFKPKIENGKKVTFIKKVRYDFKLIDNLKDTEKTGVLERGIVILEKPKAIFPQDQCGRVSMRGTVRLRVEFLKNGEIGDIKLVKGLPHGANENAILAAKKIEFLPVMKNGVVVSVKKTVAYRFDEMDCH